MVNLSCVILTKNKEQNISACLKTLGFCDEIVVVDDYSTDKTAEISQKLGARVYKRSLNNDFAGQRNFGLEKASGKWVLFIDSDERVTPRLRDEIVQIINNPLISYVGFYVRRKDVLWKEQIRGGEAGSLKLLRLARRKAGKWRRMVHEYWQVSGRKRTLINPILHYPHVTLRKFLDDINYFSSLHALANRQERKSASLKKIIIWPFGKFVYNWIFKLGFRDKTAGFVIALIMSFHSFLAWSKLWFLQKKGFTKV